MNDVREIAERMMSGPHDSLHSNCMKLAAHVLRSTEPLGDEQIAKHFQRLRKCYGDWYLESEALYALEGHIRRLQAELKTTEGRRKLLEIVYRDAIHAAGADAVEVNDSGGVALVMEIVEGVQARKDRDALRAQLAAAEQKILDLDEEVERVTTYWVQEENKAVELDTALQASQQEGERLRTALEAAKPYVRMIQLHLETEGKEGQSKARQVLALIGAAISPAPSAPQGEQPSLAELIEMARKLPLMTPEQLRQQCISFAYGNVKLHNPEITRELIAEEYDKLQGVQAATPAVEHPDTISGAELIAAERQRQMNVEGWTPEHDAEHSQHELLQAAICYARTVEYGDMQDAEDWPWTENWWKPSADPIRNLVKAGALIAAEIDRLAARNAGKEPGE